MSSLDSKKPVHSIGTIARMEAQGHYRGIVAVEPFGYVPDGMGSSARAIGYLRGLVEGLAADD